ncbi:hypothetical protein FE374_09345 [Georgenia yuyongxinii]|uniref:Terminase large subunit-like ATPase domain-containing protein n=1 Tax=Georgenia yuyongxinii TaxID=2589797 RepID=A0A5B8C298_9MICO|nr:terminase large subunit [Georgenia yuyongxinii]QDC24789.1 hypothetical protein FE374_09345 [Georgenia yuyongxinii]
MVFAPALMTPPLSEDFTTDGDWLLRFADLAWCTPESPAGIELDAWQRELLRRMLETYPPGHERAGELRYRQVLVSLGRQNGKSVIGALLGLYGLLRAPGALVIGVASTAEQARIIYDRTMFVINQNPTLKRRFERLTDTRGIQAKDGSKYEIKAAKSAAVQGLPVSLGLFDELHIAREEVWQALVNGTGGRKDGIVVGITTAGDDESALLKGLYDLAKRAAGGEATLERFGAFIWEAPASRVPEDDGELLEFLKAANPALADGRLDAQNLISDIRAMPEPDVIRYRLNRFLDSSAASFLSQDQWVAAGRGDGETFPEGRPVFAVDRSPDWGFATVTANVKVDGVTHTEVVASLVNPTLERLLQVCTQLSVHSPSMFVMDGYALRDLGGELKRRGLQVRICTQGDVVNASSLFYSKVVRRELRHGNDGLLSVQIPRTVRRNVGEAFRISRKDSSVEIDAVLATALGVWAAEVETDVPVQIF